ncbi:hypothetical protein PHLCEN_2v4956 [Hermanssonia centrifuga]|uniref:NSUN5/RCM1 N-terminal domain-containing protein n=1 Tax=Hermanssonia centrifuga TaxID=98765 RepID=A0A2R6PCG2_9APHY|nr:hypothetical protein PHLCEN_2v4956 [Hermanssonia centrifuga]
MNFYFEAAKVLDRLDAKQGSIKGVIATVPEKDRRRTAALVIETLKYKTVLCDVITAANLLKEERKITSLNLALVLVHDLLLVNGIQTSEGPIKQAVLRHKTRLRSEFQKIKIKRGVKSTTDLARTGDDRAVREALKTEECQSGNFTLAPPRGVLPTWPRRGLPDELDIPGTVKSLLDKQYPRTHPNQRQMTQRLS